VVRTTAIVGAIFVFAVVFFMLGFVVNRMFDDQDTALAGGFIAVLLIALVAGISSYRATMKKTGSGKV